MQEEYPPYTISTLLAKKLAGELTTSEEAELEGWVQRSDENRMLFESVVNPANKAERDAFLKEIDVERDWKTVQGKVFPETKTRSLSSVYKIAASVVLLLAAGVALYVTRSTAPTFDERVAQIAPGSSQAVVKLHNGTTISLSGKDNDNKKFEEANGSSILNSNGSLSYSAGEADSEELLYNEVLVPRGGEYRIVLSDGTKVWLNSETQLKFPVKFSKTIREVTVTGEAYFEVAHRADCPFVVSTLQRSKVQVYGTQFNINAYEDNAGVYITLNEGSVSVRKGDSEPTMLKPDEQATLMTNQDKVFVSAVSASQFSAWKDGLLVFDNMSFGDVATLLSRWYDVEFVFEDEALRKTHFTADIKRYATFRDVLRVFEKTNQMSFEIREKTILVRTKDG